jgi:hypothetical protein
MLAGNFENGVFVRTVAKKSLVQLSIFGCAAAAMLSEVREQGQHFVQICLDI